jgi:hypothetical protein
MGFLLKCRLSFRHPAGATAIDGLVILKSATPSTPTHNPNSIVAHRLQGQTREKVDGPRLGGYARKYTGRCNLGVSDGTFSNN